MLFTLSTIRLENFHSCTRLNSSHSFALANVAPPSVATESYIICEKMTGVHSYPRIPALYAKKSHEEAHTVDKSTFLSKNSYIICEKITRGSTHCWTLLKECIQKANKRKPIYLEVRSQHQQKIFAMQLISERIVQSSRQICQTKFKN